MSVLSLIRYIFASSFRKQSTNVPAAAGSFIDVHAHYLPAFYVDAMHQAGIHDVDGWPIPEWSAQAALAMMHRSNIALQMLSVSSPGVTFVKGQAARRLARSMNDYVAKVIKEHAPRFGAFAVLPLPDVEGALQEMEYALDSLHLDGVGLLSNYDGIYLGDPRLEPIFAELNRRRATVFVHPTQPPNFEPLSVGLPAPIMEYPFDSTRMAASLIKSGTLDRYPDIRIIVAHGGGTIPYLYPRLVTGLGLRSTKHFEQFYYDLTATMLPPQTGAILDITSSSRFLAGFDFPFMDEKTVKPMIGGLHLSNFSGSQLDGIQRINAGILFPKRALALGGKK